MPKISSAAAIQQELGILNAGWEENDTSFDDRYDDLLNLIDNIIASYPKPAKRLGGS